MSDVPYGYCHCGCGNRTSVASRAVPERGVAKGEPRHYILGHNRAKAPISAVEYIVDAATGCWVWQRARHPSGHGLKYVSGAGPRPAHRIYYETLVGPIPDGLVLDHLCCNPPCVNPAHLEPVTTGENTRRGAANRPRATHCKRGHEFTEENTIVANGRPGRACRACKHINNVERGRRRWGGGRSV